LSSKSKLFRKTKRRIKVRDLLCRLGILGYKKIITIIFKENVSKELVADLRKTGFKIVDLPQNPYL